MTVKNFHHRAFSLSTIKSTSSSSSHKPIPSFLPSHRTLEFRLHTHPTSASSFLRRTHPEILPHSISTRDLPDLVNNSTADLSNNTSTLESEDAVDRLRKATDAFPRATSRREDNWTIRCTEIDSKGNVTSSHSMSKSEICAQNGLQPRDLRRIDSRISNVVPSILVRDEAIIFNVHNIRALIKADSVILFDHSSLPSVSISTPPSSSENESEKPKFVIRSAFAHNLLKNLREPNLAHSRQSTPGTSTSSTIGTDLPYEFRALETMLGSVASSLEGELGVLKTLVSSLLDGLERNIERDKLKQLLLYSRRLSSFNSRAILVQECLDEILENDQDMANAYLSEKILDRASRAPHDHEELEQLLESFSKYVEEIVHEGKSILTNIKSTEEIIELILDSNRNTLLALDLKVSIGTMGLGTGALVAGFFGMNLRTNLESEPYAFLGVTCASIATVSCVIGYGLMRLHRLRRIGLSQAQVSQRSDGSHQVLQHIHQQQRNGRVGGVLDWDGGMRESSKPRRFWSKCKD
ncbi:hypothetical protein DFH28DRAFT_979342 [Melampsora americana]|nr:hypothetical protein DFH28DRAFT_979342 [Melampsora americana]